MLMQSWKREHYSDDDRDFKIGDRVLFALGKIEYEGVILRACQDWSDGDWVVDLEDGHAPLCVDEEEIRHADPPEVVIPDTFFAIGDRVLWRPGHGNTAYPGEICRRADPQVERGGDWFISLTGIQSPLCVEEKFLTLQDDVFMEGDEVTWTIERPNADDIVLTGTIERRSTVLPGSWVISSGKVIQSVPTDELSLIDTSEENTVAKRSERREQRRKEKWEKDQGLQNRNPDLYGGAALPGVSSTYKKNKRRKSWGWQKCPPTAVQDLAQELFGETGTYHTAKEK